MTGCRLYPFPPIVGAWRGQVGTLVAWRNGGRCLFRAEHNGQVIEVYRRDMTLFDWRPHRALVAKRCSTPPTPRRRGAPSPRNDGGTNPIAA